MKQVLPWRKTALSMAAVLAGCSSLSVDSAEGFAGNRIYIGLVRVAAPLEPANVMALPRVRQLDVTTWGLRLDRGASLGYLHDRLLSVPLDCRFVIFIRTSAELAHAETLLRSISKEEPCFVRQP